MGCCSFLKKATVATATTTTLIAALPVLGPVGAVSAVGAIVAAGVGITAAAVDEWLEIKKETERGRRYYRET